MANKQAQTLASHLDNPNVQVFLDLLSAAEGTTEHGYNTAFGGSRFDDLSDHPRKSASFTQTDKKKNTTTAAGRYQFLQGTWDGLAKQLGLDDFSAENQDIGALKLIQEAGALNDVLAGDFDKAVSKTGTKWASLPSSKYKQNKRSDEWVNNFLASRTSGEWTPAEASTLVAAAPVGTVSTGQGPSLPPGIQQIANAGMPPTPSQELAGLQSQQPLLDALAQQMQLPDQPDMDIMQAMAQPSSVPSWAQDIAAVQPGADPVSEFEPWEEALLRQGFEEEGNAARNEAIATFFGESPVPQLNLPSGLEKTINRLIASL